MNLSRTSQVISMAKYKQVTETVQNYDSSCSFDNMAIVSSIDYSVQRAWSQMHEN